MRAQKSFPKLLIAFTLLSSLWLTGGVLVAEDEATVVELFEALDAGQIEVQFIPANAAKANVIVKNMTDVAIAVELPNAFAAVPILAQLGPIGGQQQGQQGGGGQSVGGGIQGGGGQQQGFGFGNQFGGGDRQKQGGFMRIEPDKSRKTTATTVCLEHGKPDPRPRMAYQMIPIEEYTQDEKVIELCRQVGQRELPQRTAQAAAWNLANEMSWNKISKINRIESKYVGNIRYFQPSEIAEAKKFVKSLEPEKSNDYAVELVDLQ